MQFAFVFTLFFICTFCEEFVEEEVEVTEDPYAIADYSQLLTSLNSLDLEINRVLGSSAPDIKDADKLISNLQGYVFGLGPLTHNMAAEDADVLSVAKNVYRNGAPKFLSTPLNSGLIQQAFQWDENQMKALQFLYDNAGKSWRNFLNMCERHRVET